MLGGREANAGTLAGVPYVEIEPTTSCQEG